MAQFDAALVRERGVEFAVVIVKPHAAASESAAKDTMLSFSPLFPGVPIVLMTQAANGRPAYWGRRDIIRFLASIDHRRLPWRRITTS